MGGLYNVRNGRGDACSIRNSIGEVIIATKEASVFGTFGVFGLCVIREKEEEDEEQARFVADEEVECESAARAALSFSKVACLKTNTYLVHGSLAPNVKEV